MSSSVLFDAPGPRTRRRVVIASVVTGVVLVGVVALVIVGLARNGQLAPELYSPLVNPADEQFAQVWARLGSGLVLTLQAAGLAMALSLVVGFLVSVLRLSLGRVLRVPVVLVVELLRGLPVVVTILLVATLLPAVGVELPELWFLVLGLTAYNSVVISEVLRAGVLSLPTGQIEAAYAVGLTRGQVMRLIQLPQAVRSMLPALISQLVVILKDTAIGSIVLVGLQDVLYEGNTIRRALDNSLQTYALIAIIFIILCLLLSRLAVWAEKRLSRAARSEKQDDEEELANANAT